MKKTFVLVLICLVSILLSLSGVQAYDLGVTTDQHTVTITIANKGLDVVEDIKVVNADSNVVTSLRFWIPSDVEEIDILAVESGTSLNSIFSESNIWECNLSAYNLSLDPDQKLDVRISYQLPTDAKDFLKAMIYDTTSLKIIYGEDTLFYGENIDESSSLEILLHTPTESPLNLVYIVIIFVLVIVLVASMLLLMKKQRTQAKKSIIESEEMLSTKKALMLSILKDIEKKHRAKDISDETYTKLKEEFKQEAVMVMKKLEDLK